MLYDDATPISLSRENPWVKITNHFRKWRSRKWRFTLHEYVASVIIMMITKENLTVIIIIETVHILSCEHALLCEMDNYACMYV